MNRQTNKTTKLKNKNKNIKYKQIQIKVYLNLSRVVLVRTSKWK